MRFNDFDKTLDYEMYVNYEKYYDSTNYNVYLTDDNDTPFILGHSPSEEVFYKGYIYSIQYYNEYVTP